MIALVKEMMGLRYTAAVGRRSFIIKGDSLRPFLPVVVALVGICMRRCLWCFLSVVV